MENDDLKRIANALEAYVERADRLIEIDESSLAAMRASLIVNQMIAVKQSLLTPEEINNVLDSLRGAKEPGHE